MAEDASDGRPEGEKRESRVGNKGRAHAYPPPPSLSPHIHTCMILNLHHVSRVSQAGLFVPLMVPLFNDRRHQMRSARRRRHDQ